MSYVIALLGVKALYLLFWWMLSAIIAQDLSDLKGYGEKPGLATGLLLTVIAVVVWLAWPARKGSAWMRRIQIGDMVVAVAAFVLLVALTLHWFGDQTYFGRMTNRLTNSHALDSDQLTFLYMTLLPIAGVFCYWQLHLRGRGIDSPRVTTLTLIASAVALFLVIVQYLAKPDGASLGAGFYIALAASLALVAGAVVARSHDRSVHGPETAAEAASQAAGA